MGVKHDRGYDQDDLAWAYNAGFSEGRKDAILRIERKLSGAMGRRVTAQDVIKFLRGHTEEFKAFLERRT